MRPLTAIVAVLAALAILLMTTAMAFAKGESAGTITLAAPIPRDAEPGSTLTVTFTVTVPGADGHPSPVTGSPMVLKLTGPDGTATEAMGAERGTPGTYLATIKVPSSGIQTAMFGMRGSSTMADGTSSILDVPFDVDGLLFTTTAHPALAAAPAAPASAPGDYRAALIVGLLAIAVAAFAAAVVIDRRWTLRSV